MSTVVITGKVRSVNTHRVGKYTMVQKKLQKASVTEVQSGTNRRLKGKQKSPDLITITSTDLKALETNVDVAKTALKNHKHIAPRK